MSTIDLAILGMIIEGPKSAYDVQKDAESHNYGKWARISTPAVYKNIAALNGKGFIAKDNGLSAEKNKVIYRITDEGREYFENLMEHYASQEVLFQLDINLVVSNLNKLDKAKAAELAGKIEENISSSMKSNANLKEKYYEHIPDVGKAVFDAQEKLYKVLMEWINAFRESYTAR